MWSELEEYPQNLGPLLLQSLKLRKFTFGKQLGFGQKLGGVTGKTPNFITLTMVTQQL